MMVCQKGWWADDTTARLECATWWAAFDSRSLVVTAWAKPFDSLFIGHSIHRILFRRNHRQRIGAMGVYIVCSVFHSLFQTIAINQLVTFIRSAKSLRTPSNVFVINLAFCDFLMMTKTPIFIYNSFNHGYALGSAGCQAFALMGSLSGIGAAITNACIAYDR